MRGRSDLKLIQPLRRLRRQLFRVVAKTVVEIVPPDLHHCVDCIEMTGDASIEFVGVRSKTIDDVVTAFADEIIQRLKIFTHTLRLLRDGFHKAHAAVIHDAVESFDPPAQRVVYGAGSVCGCGGRIASKRHKTLINLRRLRGERCEGLSCRRFDLRLGDGALGRDRADQATGQFVDRVSSASFWLLIVPRN